MDSSLRTPEERLFQNGKSSSLSEIDESLKEQEANSNNKSKIKKVTTDISTPKKNKQVVKAVGDSGTNNCSASKNRKDSNTSSKRKSEACKAITIYAECGDGQSPTIDLQDSESINLTILHYFDFTDPLLFIHIIMIRSLNFRCQNGQEQNREEL